MAQRYLITKPTAQRSFAQQADRFSELQAQLTKRICELYADGKNSGDWGYAGTLTHINQLMQEILDSLA